MNNKFSNIQIRNHVQKKKQKKQMIQIHTFKEEGKERSKGTPQLGGQWKVQSFMALGIFHVWWPFKMN
jgi:hypothetical protein